MSFPNIFDQYRFKQLMDLSRRLPKHTWHYNWSSSDFLVFNENRRIFKKIDEAIIERVKKEISELLGDEFGNSEWGRRNPLSEIMYDCFRIEERKKFISELEKSKEQLQEKLEKPNSKSRKKDIRHRLKHLQKRIDDHHLGTEHAFLTREEVIKFMHRNNVVSRVFEYTTIIPLMEMADKYESGLDILEKAGVPSIGLFRGFQERTRASFHQNWLESFVPYASVYLLQFKEGAVEDILRRVPAITSSGNIDLVQNPDLESIVQDPKVKRTINSLGLPEEETTELLTYMGKTKYGFYKFEKLRERYLITARSFYQNQLSDKSSLLRWIAARALIDGSKVEAGEKEDAENLIKRDLDGIVEALSIDAKHPRLNSNRDLLAKRFIKYSPWKLKGSDPYDLNLFEELIPLTEIASTNLERFGVSLSIEDFCDLEHLSSIKEGIISFNQEILDDTYVAVEKNKYFRRFVSQEFNIFELLRDSPRNVATILPTLRDISLELVDYTKLIGEDKFDEVSEFIFDRIGFDSLTASTYQLYRNYLGKDFFQFMRDFQATGESFKRLPKVKQRYGQFFDDDRLKSIVNYVGKKRSRDLIETLTDYNISEHTIATVAEKLDPQTGKKETVSVLSELNKTYNFLENVGAGRILSEKLQSLPKRISGQDALDALKDVRRQCYAKVIGDATDVPVDLEWMLDNIIIAFYKQDTSFRNVDIQPALQLIASTYLAESPEAAFNAIRNQEANLQLRSNFESKGINIWGYERGISRSYHLKSDENQVRKLRERIDSELTIIYDRLNTLGVSIEDIKTVQTGSVVQQLNGVEKILKDYQFTEETKPLKTEMKGHIHTIKSVGGTVKEMEDDVDFYVSTDPFEALHMGQYFGSCLSLAKNHNGVNSWASVVQVMDSNKNVIYAKGLNGNYVGRNRTALTDQGVLCTRFYQNGGLFIEDAWIDYLSEFGDNINQDVIIPTMFASPTMQKRLRKAPNVVKKEVTVHIDPAYFSSFYGDGLLTKKLEDGKIQITTNAYVIPKV